MFHFHGSLRSRLMVLVLLSVLPALGLILYSGLEQRRWAASRAQEDALRLVRHACLDQERLVQGATQLLTAIAQLPSIQEPNQASIPEFLRRLLQQHSVYTNLGVLGADGTVLYSGLPFSTPVNYSDSSWFRRAMETRALVIGEYQVGRISGKVEVPLASPVFAQTGQLQLMVYAALDLSWLSGLAAKIELPPGSTLAIVDRQGTFLVRHPDPMEWTGKTMADMHIIKGVLSKEEGTVEAVGVDGNLRLYAFASLKDMPEGLFMRVGLLKKEVVAKANQVLVSNLIALGFVLVLALLAARWLGSLLIVRGISALVATADRVAAGDLNVRTGLGQGEGEIQQLARAFDKMVEALQQWEAEHQRAEAELEKIRKYLENVFNESADGIGIVDERGKFTRWNKAALELYGYTLEEIRGKSAFDLYEDKNELEKMMGLLRRDGYVRNYEINMQKKDGCILPFALSIRLLRDNDSRVFGSVTVARDLSEVKQVMAESKAINERLQGEISERQQIEITLQETLEKLKGTVREVEQRNRHITLLNELTDLLQSCLTRKEAHDSIAHFIPQLFPCSSGTLFVLNPRKGLLLEAVAGWGEIQSDEQVYTADSCWALRRGGVHFVKRESSALICQHVPTPLSADYMCVPMIAQGEILGLLYLQAPSDQSQGPPEEAAVHLNDTDQHLAVTVAKQISLALANLSLRESLQIQAIVDPLTGLFNRRYMEETFERELHRAIRRKAPIGVIMIDLDYFKRINDNFGHDAGDLVLVTLAGLFKRSVRREDVPCRYGGEEFLLIMPEASLEITCQRAEKLREQIGQLEVKHLGLALGTITASFGVACYPDHGEQVEEIIRMADAALYSAKQKGRNRVIAGKSLVRRGSGNQPVAQDVRTRIPDIGCRVGSPRVLEREGVTPRELCRMPVCIRYAIVPLWPADLGE